MPKPHASPTIAASPSRREFFVLIGAGVFLALLFGDWGRYSVDQVLPFVIAAGFLLVTPLVRGLNELLERVRHPSPRAATIGAVTVTMLAFIVIVGVPLAGGDELIPRSHDEHMHLLQMQMLARGRLWMPPHPHGDFFESFFVLTRPVYASIYFPGTALLLTPTVWFGLPYWFMPAIYSAAAVGLLYRVLTEAFDGVAGVLGAMLLLSSALFREVALLPMSHNVMLMLALSATYAWLRWRRAVAEASESKTALRWALLAGAAGGLAAITRPLDALCYVAPLAVASLPALWRMPGRTRLMTLGVAVAGAAPFLALQLVLNAGTTGSLLASPYQLYLDTQQPGTGYGFATPDPLARPQSQLPQKHLYYEEFHRPAIAKHRPARVGTEFLRERMPLLFMTTVAHPLLLLVLPLGLLGLRALPAQGRVRVAAMLAALPMLAIGYAFNPLLLSHYLVVWMPPMILLVLLAPLALAASRPRLAPIMPAAATLILLAAIVSAQPGINPTAQAPWTAPQMSDIHEKLAALPHKPAVVLFRFDPRQANVHHEPVYNVDVAWPDDAEVIRAHDLGERNVELVRYYVSRQPDRHFYRYDRSSGELEELGPARAVLERMAPATTNAASVTP